MQEKLEVIFKENLLVGESPIWDEKEGKLWFVDIRGKAFYRMDYCSGEYKKVNLPQAIGCMALCENGELLLSMEDGIYRYNKDTGLRLAHQPIKIKGQRFNDGKVGPDGCYYVGTSGAGFSGAFYRLKDRELTELFDRCDCSNGIDWSADQKTMFYCDSNEYKLEKFDFCKRTHSLSNRRTVVDIPKEFGKGDGLSIDENGNIWLAIWGGSCVQCIEPSSGKILQTIKLPVKQVSSCCFAGEDMQDLIITTASINVDLTEQPLAGNVFRCKLNVKGTKANRF